MARRGERVVEWNQWEIRLNEWVAQRGERVVIRDDGWLNGISGRLELMGGW